jgi:bud site selection protein 31
VDAALAAKWKKPGYEKLCCTYAINTKNFKFGTVAICRVPKKYLSDDTVVEETNCGCRGCSSGDQGERNIFGNKYGQYLAAIQVRRERRQAKEAAAAAVAAATEEEEEEEEGEGGGKGTGKRKQPDVGVWADGEAEDEGDDEESEEEDEDDYGPSASSGKRATEADAEAEAYVKLHKKSKV